MSTAHRRGYKIHLSGHGVDEIMSDYAGSPISNFKGKFPEILDLIYPKYSGDIRCVWKNFYNGTNARNILREELVSSAFGIETRYPFLDKTVVQEFLSLSVDLKNNAYKAPLKHYLELNQYPFDLNQKAGLWINVLDS